MPLAVNPQRVALVDPRTGLITREWLRLLEELTGSASSTAGSVTNVLNEITQLITQQTTIQQTIQQITQQITQVQTLDEDAGLQTQLSRLAAPAESADSGAPTLHAELGALRADVAGLAAGWEL